MSKVQRGEKLLNRLVTEQKLTHTGRDWLMAAVDPFHDTILQNLEGWPDAECGASVVRCIKQSITVAAPAFIPANTNWDCHVVMWPWLSGFANNYAQSLSRTNNVIGMQNHPITAANAPVGGLQVYGASPGTDLNILQPAGPPIQQIGRLDLNNIYTQGSGRLLGVGYEVHNTTADLYKQGSVTVYRQQADFPTSTTFVGSGAITAGGRFTCPFTGVPVRYPPVNTATAMLLAGSRQWTAEEGVYQVAAFMSEVNPAGPIAPQCPVILGFGQDDLEVVSNVTNVNYQVPLTPIATDNIAPIKPIRVHPIHQSGCIFTGLSYQTTLTINYNIFYESFPGPSDLDILVLAKPSAQYDPCAIEFYSRILSEIPVGVPVCENGLGDWFLQAASEAAKYIGPAIAALPHPMAKGAGAALSYLGETGSNYVKRQVPPNAWEQQSGGVVMSDQDFKTVENTVRKAQKKKDKKKTKKLVAQAQANRAKPPPKKK